MKSWKTTSLGIATALVPLLNAFVALLDDNTATNPDWVAVVAAVTGGLGLIFAKDSNVTGGTVKQ